MKKSARNRIIVWSTASVLLIAILVLGIVNINKFGLINLSPINIGDISNVDDFTTGAAEFDKNSIKSLDINWTSGEVNVEQGESDKIIITEECSSNVIEDRMCWNVDENGRLSVYSSKKSKVFFGFSFNSDESKVLTVKVPKNMSFDSFYISSASADIKIYFADADKVVLETASGDINAEKIMADEADITNVSGDIEAICQQADRVTVGTVSGNAVLNGVFRDLDAESVSGALSIYAESDGVDIDSESVSGKITVSLPEDISGFTAKYESVSGLFESDFVGMSKDDSFVYGDGRAEISMETVSGNMVVEQHSVIM